MRIELRALRGNDPLGFLAALGVVWLCDRQLGIACRLGWPDGPANAASLDADGGPTGADLAALLRSVAVDTHVAGRPVPGLDGFPPTQEGGGSDPVRNLSLDEGRGYARRALERPTEPWGEWVTAVASVAPMRLDKGKLNHSAFLAGPGTVWLSRTLKKHLDAVVSDADALPRALGRWRRRTIGLTGAYLDHRAFRDTGTTQQLDKAVLNRVEIGATWLALMAMPWFPMRADEQERAPCWHERRRFRWPVWSEVSDPDAVAVILDHPAVAFPDPAALASLGVDAVYEAERRAGSDSDGPLGAARRLWPHG